MTMTTIAESTTAASRHRSTLMLYFTGLRVLHRRFHDNGLNMNTIIQPQASFRANGTGSRDRFAVCFVICGDFAERSRELAACLLQSALSCPLISPFCLSPSIDCRFRTRPVVKQLGCLCPCDRCPSECATCFHTSPRTAAPTHALHDRPTPFLRHHPEVQPLRHAPDPLPEMI